MMENPESVFISLSLDKNLLKRMNKYVVHSIAQKKRLTINITPFLHTFYESMEKGNRSYIISTMIKDYLDILEKEQIGKIFKSKSELVRNVLTHFRVFRNVNRIISYKYKVPKVKLPLGNIYHINGDWRKFHTEQQINRYDKEEVSDM